VVMRGALTIWRRLLTVPGAGPDVGSSGVKSFALDYEG
jgi:hypothetical protein